MEVPTKMVDLGNMFAKDGEGPFDDRNEEVCEDQSPTHTFNDLVLLVDQDLKGRT